MVGDMINRVPVVSDGVLVGIVSRADLVRAFIRSDEELERDIREDVCCLETGCSIPETSSCRSRGVSWH